MATQSVKTRAWGSATSTAGTTKTINIPSSYVAGDLIIVKHVGANPLDSVPTGWSLRGKSVDTSQLYSYILVKRATSGDPGSTLSLPVSGAGKSSTLMLGLYSNAGPVRLLTLKDSQETTLSATHAVAGIRTAGPGMAITLLGVKDPTTANPASGTYTPPAIYGTTSAPSVSGGSSQVCAIGAVYDSADVGASLNFGAGASWTVTAADGTTPVTSQHAITWQLYVAACLAPASDVTVAPGATFVGGSTISGVTSNDDPTNYVQYSGTAVTNEVTVPIKGTVPSMFYVHAVTDTPASSTSIQGFAYLGSTQLLDCGTVATLLPSDPGDGTGGTFLFFDLAPLTDAQKASILADSISGAPQNLRLRWVSSVA